MPQNNPFSPLTQAPPKYRTEPRDFSPLKIAFLFTLLFAAVLALAVGCGNDKSAQGPPSSGETAGAGGAGDAGSEVAEDSGTEGTGATESVPTESTPETPETAPSAPPAASAGGHAFEIPPTEESPKEKLPFRIGLVTGAGGQGEDFAVGVRTVMDRYGDAQEGGSIVHRTYPDDFISRYDEVLALIEGLAEDPLVKVIVVVEGVPGTALAFQRIRERRPDILLLTGESHEDIATTSATTDMYVGTDFISRGYLIPKTAKDLGAKTFVHVSFPRHMLNEPILRRRYIMEEACKDLGITFVYENAPDPTAETGIQYAKDFIKEHMPIWISQYGPDTAFFTTNNAHTEPMVAGIVELGGYFVEPDVPSPIMGYPEALGLDLSDIRDNYPEMISRVEKALEEKGASGRLGSWAGSISIANIVGLVEFGKLVALGKVALDDYDALLKCFEDAAQGIKFNGQPYMDTTQKVHPNIFLLYEDTYIFGKGFMGNTSLEIPFKYGNLSSF
jgi:hypothetical protein